MNVAGRVRVAHGDGVVEQHEFNFEFFAVRAFPNLTGSEAVVGINDRCPPGPDV